MKNFALLCLLMSPMFSAGQNPVATEKNVGSSELEAVLSQMDKAAARFKTAQAEFDWDNYQKVVDETDKQKGQVYFQRRNQDVEAMFDITAPSAKQILFKDGKLSIYEPKIDQITEHTAGKNKSDVEAFLGLGFGAHGHDLLKNYQVKMAGWETVDAVKTARLELVAISPKVRNMFSQFVLWIDPQRDVPIRQQVFAPSGDYWLSHYTNIRLNGKLPQNAFRIDSKPGTKVARVQ